jgi:alpha-L-rhamnosidase
MAQGIGRTVEAAELRRQAADIATLYNQRYFNASAEALRARAETNQYEGSTQTANLVPLWFGITPEDKRAAVIDNIAKNIIDHRNHLTTGFIGTAYLMPALSTFDKDDLAGQLAVQRSYPSWGYMVDAGATTIWERWNSDQYEELHSGMNSFNHYALGTVGQWYYEYLAGIRPLEPGFKRILIEPHPSAAQWAEASFHSMYGPIRCAWHREKGFRMTVAIPANTTALVKTPEPCDADLGPNDRKTVDSKGNTSFEVGAGVFTFTATQK